MHPRHLPAAAVDPVSVGSSSFPLPAAHQSKRSGRSRLLWWVRHAVARQSATPQVAAIKPDETLYGLFDLSTGSVETASKCDNSDLAQVHEEYQPEPLTLLQREDLRRRNMDALHTPIIGETPEARALEDARLANLAERTRRACATTVPESSRCKLCPPPT